MVGGAGVLAALTDVLLVRIPKTMNYIYYSIWHHETEHCLLSISNHDLNRFLINFRVHRFLCG